jgi:hypothetical protein
MPENLELLAQMFKRQPEMLNKPMSEIPGAKLGMMPFIPSGSWLSKLFGRSKPPVTPPSAPPSLPPEFTAVGGEATYNAGKAVPAVNGADSLLESIYQRLLQRGGR